MPIASNAYVVPGESYGCSRALRLSVYTSRPRRREHRVWQRIRLALPVFVRGADEHGAEFLEFTAALNVSAGGMLVSLRHHLRRGTRVHLEIPETPARQAATPNPPGRIFDARLIRVEDSGGSYLYAFRFRRPLRIT